MKANFHISSSQKISQEFQKRNISDFQSAAKYVRYLPYGRNANKQNPETIFTDGCGTCSTKHALLKQLAIENNQEEIKLIIGLFRMNGTNSPKVKSTLTKYQLDFIPEAHCYLKIGNDILDAMTATSKAEDFIEDLIEEIEILPEQITDFKVNYHKNYLQKWLNENPSISYSLRQLWNIREQCIKDLGIKIREYHVNDKPKLIEILRLNVPKYFAESEIEDFEMYLDKEIEKYFVIEYSGEIVGAGGINFENNYKVGKISWDFINPKFQGIGLGGKLLKHRIELLKSTNSVEIIFVRTSQLAYKFYEKNGFVLNEIQKDYWAKGFDMYKMIYQQNENC